MPRLSLIAITYGYHRRLANLTWSLMQDKNGELNSNELPMENKQYATNREGAMCYH